LGCSQGFHQGGCQNGIADKSRLNDENFLHRAGVVLKLRLI
jgi:hypothetical protein